MAKPSLKFRLHEWLADHINWVQYPGVSMVSNQPFFKHQMHWTTRISLLMISLFVLAICAVALFFLGLLFWALFTA